MEILLTGRRLSAAEALQCGLVNRVVPADQLMETANGIADLICRNGPLAVRTAKEIAVRGAMGMSWEQAWSMESLWALGRLAARTRSRGLARSWRSVTRVHRPVAA